jgi:UDP-GlcNAc:undecaprenyl-phosphate GlcNAc-1-phosphate transferase
METNLYILLINALVILIICQYAMKYLIKFFNQKKLVDMPDERKLHQNPTPTSGGIIFLIPVLIAFFLTDIFAFEVYLIVGFFVLALLGFIDDRYDLSSKLKFLIQFAIAIFYVSFFGNMSFFEDSIGLNSAQANVITVLFIVGVINAFNLIDGSDGLSGLYALLVFTIFAIYSLYIGDNTIAFFSVSIISGLLIFLKFNWNPAKIFMGDTGSLALGFIIAVFGIQLSNLTLENSLPFETLFLPLLALPVFDTLRVMSWRLRFKRNPFKADRTHFHHLLQFLKLPPNKIALAYSMLTLIIVLASLIVFILSSELLTSLVIAMFVSCIVFVSVLKLIKRKQKILMAQNRNRMLVISRKNQLLTKYLVR